MIHARGENDAYAARSSMRNQRATAVYNMPVCIISENDFDACPGDEKEQQTRRVNVEFGSGKLMNRSVGAARK